MEKFEYIKIILDEINFKYDDIEFMTNEEMEFIVIHVSNLVQEDPEMLQNYVTVKRALLEKMGVNVVSSKLAKNLVTMASNITNLEMVDVDEEDLRLLVKLRY